MAGVIAPEVLIIGANELSSSAVTAAARGSGWRTVTPARGDTPRHSVDQVRPAYVLLDAEHPGAADPSLYAILSRLRTRAVLYGNERSWLVMRQLAVRFGIATVDVPFDAPDFAAALEHRLDLEEWLAGWLSQRRTPGAIPIISGPDDTIHS